MKTKTWLPEFSGFYESIWLSSDDDRVEYDLREDLAGDGNLEKAIADKLTDAQKEYILGNYWDTTEYDIAVKEYKESVAQSCTYAMEAYINDKLGTKLSFVCEKIASPKEYNFSTDSIDIDVSYRARDVKIIQEYILTNIDKYTEYIKSQYTSYDGFCSFHGNDINQWLDFRELAKHSHKLGSILAFVCENEGFNELDDLYYEVTDCYISVLAENVINELSQRDDYPASTEAEKKRQADRDFVKQLETTNLTLEFAKKGATE